VVARGVREPNRVGAADQAEPAHRARERPGNILEDVREPRRGMRGERDPGRPGLAGHGGRARRVAQR
jgi:hypothetical protein